MRARAHSVSTAPSAIINATVRTIHRAIQQPANASVSAVGWDELAIKNVQLVITVRIAKRNVLRTCRRKQLAIMSLASLNVAPDTLASHAIILAKKELSGKIVKRNVAAKMAANARTSMAFAIAYQVGLEICAKIRAQTQHGESTANINANASTMLAAGNLMASVFASPVSWARSARRFALKVIMAPIVSRSATATKDRTQFATQPTGVFADPVTKDRTATSLCLASFHPKKKVSCNLHFP